MWQSGETDEEYNLMEDGLIDIYYSKLKNGEHPTSVLTQMCGHLLDFKPERTHYSGISKLIKLYGVDLVFYSILDSYDMESVQINSLYGLLAYFCKKRTKEKYSLSLDKDLNVLSRKNMETKSKKELKFNDPFEEK